jgi:hypothetical protein
MWERNFLTIKNQNKGIHESVNQGSGNPSILDKSLLIDGFQGRGNGYE